MQRETLMSAWSCLRCTRAISCRFQRYVLVLTERYQNDKDDMGRERREGVCAEGSSIDRDT